MSASTRTSTPRSTEVFVIGGGPAGLAAAIAARLHGFRVLVADGATPPIDKACGEGLMPDGLAALRELGVELRRGDGFAFRGVRFVDEGSAVETRFPRGIAGAGMGVRRAILQQRMLERAAALGVEFLWATPVVGLRDGGVEIARPTREVIAARWIIGADGSGSRVRKWSGLEEYTQKESRFAFRRHYRVAPWTDGAEVYWGARGQAYVTPVSAKEVCVVAITRHADLRSGEILREFPALVEQLSGAELTSSERGAVTSTHRLRRVTRGDFRQAADEARSNGQNVAGPNVAWFDVAPNGVRPEGCAGVALIGDASGGVDAITGEGLCLSFHQAARLADALECGNLDEYERAHRKLARRPNFMATMMLALDRRPTLRHRVLRVFTTEPEIFARFVAMHVGETSALHAARTGAVFGWRLLASSAGVR
jgi:2-polyprenyl-6-methoxyphenol hydroxylase-like FAD-dependent oxidoreductase